MITQRTTTQAVVTVSEWDINVTRTYEANRNGLMAAAGRICGPDQAADIAQDAFVRVWSNPERFDPARGPLTQYLYVVTRGISIDRVRATASQRARDTRVQARTVDLTDEPASGVFVAERQDRVLRAMASLHQCQRDVIEAAYFGHLTYREVAVKFNLPEGTVKSRIRLGLIRLRRDLIGMETRIA